MSQIHELHPFFYNAESQKQKKLKIVIDPIDLTSKLVYEDEEEGNFQEQQSRLNDILSREIISSHQNVQNQFQQQQQIASNQAKKDQKVQQQQTKNYIKSMGKPIQKEIIEKLKKSGQEKREKQYEMYEGKLIEKVIPQKKSCDHCLEKVYSFSKGDQIKGGRFQNLKQCEGKCDQLEKIIQEKDNQIGKLRIQLLEQQKQGEQKEKSNVEIIYFDQKNKEQEQKIQDLEQELLRLQQNEQKDTNNDFEMQRIQNLEQDLDLVRKDLIYFQEKSKQKSEEVDKIRKINVSLISQMEELNKKISDDKIALLNQFLQQLESHLVQIRLNIQESLKLQENMQLVCQTSNKKMYEKIGERSELDKAFFQRNEEVIQNLAKEIGNIAYRQRLQNPTKEEEFLLNTKNTLIQQESRIDELLKESQKTGQTHFIQQQQIPIRQEKQQIFLETEEGQVLEEEWVKEICQIIQIYPEIFDLELKNESQVFGVNQIKEKLDLLNQRILIYQDSEFQKKVELALMNLANIILSQEGRAQNMSEEDKKLIQGLFGKQYLDFLKTLAKKSVENFEQNQRTNSQQQYTFKEFQIPEQRQNEFLEKENLSLKQKIELLEEENWQLQRNFKNLDEDRYSLQQENQQMQEKIHFYQNQIDDALQQIQNNQITISQLQKTNEYIENEIQTQKFIKNPKNEEFEDLRAFILIQASTIDESITIQQGQEEGLLYIESRGNQL